MKQCRINVIDVDSMLFLRCVPTWICFICFIVTCILIVLSFQTYLEIHDEGGENQSLLNALGAGDLDSSH